MNEPVMLDEAARLDMSVHRREITKEQAVFLLVKFTDGGLTRMGALDVLDNWREMKAGRAGCIPGTTLPHPGKSNLIGLILAGELEGTC